MNLVQPWATMKAAVALLVSVAMLGCFPHNPRHRTYAKWAEGGALVAGIAISAVANTGADCDAADDMMGPNTGDSSCRTTAKWLGTAGLVLILGGLLGFVATISTAEDAALQAQNAASVKAAADKNKEEKSKLTLPAGVQPGQPQPTQPTNDSNAPGSADPQEAPANGSGSGSPSAPQY